jgi:hypothetical protein
MLVLCVGSVEEWPGDFSALDAGFQRHFEAVMEGTGGEIPGGNGGRSNPWAKEKDWQQGGAVRTGSKRDESAGDVRVRRGSDNDCARVLTGYWRPSIRH